MAKILRTVSSFGVSTVWAVLPWRQCKAALEPNETPYWGRCERVRRHDGFHALERGFDVVWFGTRIVDAHQEWETLPAYAQADIAATEGMLSANRPCDCSAHDITEPGASHANDCPAYDGPNPMAWWEPKKDPRPKYYQPIKNYYLKNEMEI